MNAHHCHNSARAGPHPATFVGRCFNALGWLLPATVLALFPKCPACLAVWVAAATGLGLSFTTASYLRVLLGVLCVAALLYWLVRIVRLVRRSTQRKQVQESLCVGMHGDSVTR